MMSMSLFLQESLPSGGNDAETVGYRSRFLRHMALASANLSEPKRPSMRPSVALNLETSSSSAASRNSPAVTASL